MEKGFEQEFSPLKGKKVLIACSTGIDSMVLLDIALKLLEKKNIGIIHIHHNRRKQSDTEETFIKEYAKTNNIPLYFKKLPQYEGSNFQAWAREERYHFFTEIAKENNYEYILLAHHADDNFETIIMRLLKSSSLKGYSGIDQLTEINGIKIYRPLLSISKDEIKAYTKDNQIVYFEDDSNNHDDYKRNRIRHYVLPNLKEENPNWVDAINNYHKTLNNANDIIENILNDFINNKVKIYTFNHLLVKEFMIKDFIEINDFIKEQVIFRLNKNNNFSKKTINELIRQIISPKEKIINNLTNNLHLIKEYGKCQLVSGEFDLTSFSLKIEKEGQYLLKNNCQIIVNNNICEFIIDDYCESYPIKKLPITIRTKQEGDKISLKTGTISISDFLTNHKVPYISRINTMIIENENQEIIRICYYQKEEDVNG